MDVARIKRGSWGWIVLWGISLSAKAAVDDRIAFDIPEKSFSQAVIDFAQQADVEILYASVNPVSEKKTRALIGRFALSDALAVMLEGTGFDFKLENPRSVLLKDAPSRGLTSEHVAAAATPDADQAAGATSHTPATPEIVITGSYLHGVLDVMSPLTFVTRAEMNRAPYATVEDALQELPANLLSARNEFVGGADNFNRGTAPNLRGLGYGATLVLINGTRPPAAGADASFVDVSNIPLGAVDHIEILPEGASALYGSDAIAGVINIIMRDHLEGLETQIRGGLAEGGAAETVASQLFGKQWNTGRLFLAYQYSSRTALAASDRDYTADADKRPFGGSDFRSYSGNPGNILDPSTLQPAFAIPAGQNGRHLTAQDLAPGAANLSNPFASYDLMPDRRTHYVFANASQALSRRIEAFAEMNYAQRTVQYRDFPYEQTLIVPRSNPFFIDPFGEAPFTLVAYNFSEDLGMLHGEGETRSLVGTAGLRMQMNEDWRASLAASYGSEHLRFITFNQVDPYALNKALADRDPATAFNPFGDGSHTAAATLEAIRQTTNFAAHSEIASIKLVADGTLLSTPAGAVKLAVGSENRRESLRRQFLSDRPREHYQREIAAAFAELSLPLIGNIEQPHAIPSLELSLAGRYEHYSDFGDTFNPKVGLRWVPFRSLKLRGSWGSSFKAPKLVDLYDTTNNASAVVSLPDPASRTGYSVVAAIQGSNPDLSEETARSWTAGIDLAPLALPGLTLSFTYYDIHYQNQVVQPGPPAPDDILREEERWSPVIARNPSRAEIAAVCHRSDFMGSVRQCLASSPDAIIDFRVRNLSDTRTRGLDIKLDYPLATRLGAFHFTADATQVFSFDRALTRASPHVSVLDTLYQSPSLRMRSGAEWNRYGSSGHGPGINLGVSYVGAYRDPENPLRRSIDAWTTVDLQLRYRMPRTGLSAHTEFALGASNLFDAAAPFVNSEFGYDFYNAQPYGRVISFYVQKSW